MKTFDSTLDLADQLHNQGFAVLEKCLSAEAVARFVALTESARESRESESAVANSAGVYALRNLTDVVPETTELVRNPAVREIVETIPYSLRVTGLPFAITVRGNFRDTSHVSQ